MDGRVRNYGEITVTFRTAQDAKDFDNYLNSTVQIVYAGEIIDSYKVSDRFNPIEFFGIKKGE